MQGIARLEGEMQAVRALLGNSSTIVAALREIATPSTATRYPLKLHHEIMTECEAAKQTLMMHDILSFVSSLACNKSTAMNTMSLLAQQPNNVVAAVHTLVCMYSSHSWLTLKFKLTLFNCTHATQHPCAYNFTLRCCFCIWQEHSQWGKQQRCCRVA